MSEPKLISPMLDNFMMGDPISEHKGVRCCPAMDETNGNKYIVKIISSPATPAQLDAMLLSGAFDSKESALRYYEEIAQGIMEEAESLKALSELEGFMAFDDSQLVPMDDGNGYDVYLLSTYKMTLAKFLKRNPITHLQALNLGLDLCAALTVCRRSGYIYANLKPENIYMTVDNGFRIGDLGFLKLSGLKFAALPDRYRSDYTAPEMVDAFATLNTTIDTYAVGLILYQTFNAGQLPTPDEDGAISAPDYADYEMAEIILRACDPDPEKRWEDPEQMGRAIVDYMQKNGAHDVPIVPPVVEVPAETEEAVAEEATVEDAQVVEDVTTETAEEAVAETPEIISADDPAEEDPETIEESPVEDETLPSEEEAQLNPDELSEELSEMISQVDELVNHEVPEPVVAPEPIEVQLPVEEVIPAEEEISSDEETPAEEESEEIPADHSEEEPATVIIVEGEEVIVTDEDEEPKKKSHWLRYTILAVILLAVLAAGFLFYKFYYVQRIDNLTCVGTETELTVKVETEADESLLTVVCTSYGNKFESPVKDGVAVFHDLQPNTRYTVEIQIDGFHKLTGKTSFDYTTPQQTVIENFNAQTSTVKGAVLLSFAVSGPAECDWSVSYVNDIGETVSVPCVDHSATITDLTIGNQYLFKLVPSEDIAFTGTKELTYTAVKPIIAQDVYTGAVVDGTLTVYWFSSDDADMVNWTVRCYNDSGYTQEISTTELYATFENITPGTYTIDVQATGMPAAEPITVNTEATEVKNIQVSTEDNRTIVTWECNAELEGNWSVEYTLDSNVINTVEGNEECRIVLAALIPDARYKITLHKGENELIGNTAVVLTPAADSFDDHGLTGADISVNMCVTPDIEDWDAEDVANDAYTTKFTVGQRASFVVDLLSYPWGSREAVVVQIVIRNEDGILAFSTDEYVWNNMWDGTEGTFDLPALPTVVGDYTATIYFNGTVATEQHFTVAN